MTNSTAIVLADIAVDISEFAVEGPAPVKAEKEKKVYPFLTKAQILSRINSDDEFAVRCLLIIAGRQTEDEMETRDTKWKNRRGFMSSHAKVGTELAEKILNGGDYELSDVTLLASRYTKQLAEHFRAHSLAENPELARLAAVFGL
jgi:hypothetical protein